MNFQDHISRDPQICGGEAVIRETRVTLRTVLASLAEGAGEAEIIRSFPALTSEDVRAAIAFAAHENRTANVGLRRSSKDRTSEP